MTETIDKKIIDRYRCLQMHDGRYVIGLLTNKTEESVTINDALYVYFVRRPDGNVQLSYDKYCPFTDSHCVVFDNDSYSHIFKNVHPLVIQTHMQLMDKIRSTDNIMIDSSNFHEDESDEFESDEFEIDKQQKVWIH